ncbi:MAG: hypothetical protein AAF511_05385 [Pseudomonadota bacterium]
MRALRNIAAWAAMSPVLAAAGEWEFGGEIAGELRVFPQEPATQGQLSDFQPSVYGLGDIRWTSDNGKHQLVAVPFYRLDGEDDERTHADLREGYYRYAGNTVDILIGAGKVFWGVAESRHLVDIVNQTDAVEDIDEEDKLGQPMVKLSVFRDWGTVDLFVLPYFRPRTFPGERGRLRFDPVINDDDPVYEDGDEEWNTDFAIRYSHFFGSFDVGVSGFSGTSREPRFAFSPQGVDANGQLIPFYDQINQVGVDVQYTNEAWLWKFEGIVREGQGDTFAATVAGFEYTFFGVTQGGADLGVLVEHLYDGRDAFLAPPTASDNDLFYGARYALNDFQDTAILIGAITDLENGSSSGLIEAERRFGQNWTAELEARFFYNVDNEDLLRAFEDDSVLTFRLTRYF